MIPDGPYESAEIDPRILEECLIFRRDDRILYRLRNICVIYVGAFSITILHLVELISITIIDDRALGYSTRFYQANRWKVSEIESIYEKTRKNSPSEDESEEDGNIIFECARMFLSSM